MRTVSTRTVSTLSLRCIPRATVATWSAQTSRNMHAHRNGEIGKGAPLACRPRSQSIRWPTVGLTVHSGASWCRDTRPGSFHQKRMLRYCGRQSAGWGERMVFRRRTAVPGVSGAPARSLAEALAAVPDPRRPDGWRPEYAPIPLVALLQVQVTVSALLCGARGQSAVAQWGRERLEDDPDRLVALGLPAGRSPCVATLHRVFKQLDVAAFEAALGGWLARTGSGPRDAIAVAGKVVRGTQPRGEGASGPGSEAVPGTDLVAA